MAVPFEQTSGRLQDRIARLIGVQLPDGRRYRNGVIISAGDAAAADQTQARTAALDTQVRGQAIQNIPSQAGTISTFDNRAVGFLNQARADGRIETSRLPQARGGSMGVAQPGDAVVPAGDLYRARQTLIGANGLAPNRIYTPATLANATPQQILNEAALLPSRFALRDQRIQQGEQGAEAAAFGGIGNGTDGANGTNGGGLGGFVFPRFGGVGAATGGGYGGNPNASDLLFRDNRIDVGTSLTSDPVPADARNVTDTVGAGVRRSGGSTAPAALPGEDVEAAVTGAVARYRAAGGRDPQRAKQIADTARFLADPTGEISYQRQLARQQQAADAAQKRLDDRQAIKDTQAEQGAEYFLGESDRLDALQTGLVQATAPTPAQERAALAAATNLPALNGAGIFNLDKRGKVKSIADAEALLADDPDSLAAVREAYDAALDNYRKVNETRPAALKAAQALKAQANRVGALNRSVDPAAVLRVLQRRSAAGGEQVESPESRVQSAEAGAPLTEQDVAEFAATLSGGRADAGAAPSRFSAPAWSLRGLGQRAATLAPAAPRVLSQGLDGFSQIPDNLIKRGGAAIEGLYSGDFRVPEGPGPIERLSRWFGRDVLGGLAFGAGESRALADSQRARRDTDAELARREGSTAQALADLFAKRRAVEGNRLAPADRVALATSLGLPADAGIMAISRAAMAREQELRRNLGAN